MDTQPLPSLNPSDHPARETRRPWWRCGGGEYSDTTWLWIIFFMTSSTGAISSTGQNPFAWLVLGASAVLGLLLWWGASRKRR